jgi:hypothetical protein
MTEQLTSRFIEEGYFLPGDPALLSSERRGPRRCSP